MLRQVGLPGDPDDSHSRYIEAEVDGLIVASIYLPNGNPIGTEKFDYKLRWMERLRARAAATTSPALEADAEHLRTDALSSMGVLLGLVLMQLTGATWLDPVIALLVAVGIVGAGLRIMRSSSRVLIDETLPATELDAIRRSIDASRADQIELRAALDAARGDAAELRAELATTKAESRERRNALEKLANAGLFKRRRVVADLQGRGVL